MWSFLTILALSRPHIQPAVAGSCNAIDASCSAEQISESQAFIQTNKLHLEKAKRHDATTSKDVVKDNHTLSSVQPKNGSSTVHLPDKTDKANLASSQLTHSIDALHLSENMQQHKDINIASTPSPEEAANEPASAPSFFTCVLIFTGAALTMFGLTLLICSLLQMLRNRLISHAHGVSVDDMRHTLSERSKPGIDVVKSNPSAPTQFDQAELASLLNGNHLHLELLLSLANSQYPATEVKDLVLKSAKASKLKLSETSLLQVNLAVQILAEDVQKLCQKRDSSNLSPREKLIKAMREVRDVVKIERWSAHTAAHAEVQNWTSNEDHADHHADKYAHGSKSSLHGGHKSRSSVENYFASEEFEDHLAMVFICAYGQLFALVYAMYLKWRFPLMYAFMGPWLLVSRGEAMAIIVYTVIMVALMSRRLITWLRNYVEWSSVLALVVDKHVLMHRCCGMMLPVAAALHVLGHLRGSIPAILHEADDAVINKAFTYGTKIKFNFNTWAEAARCWPAVTGYVLIAILIAFWASSNERARRYFFEGFQYLHLTLIVVWCIALSLHGAKQWLGVGYPLGAIAVAPIVLYYVLERIRDIWQGISPEIKIASAVIKKRTVLLEIDKGSSNFTYETGMYCMLKVPEISEYQWHPFTIASAGGERYFQVLFAIVGDWTTQLKDLIEASQKNKKPYPEICVRGGYGAPAETMKEKKHVVMVGAGVGATPFLSFLSNICSAAKAGRKSQFDGLQTAVFYWVSREPDDFVWVNKYNTVIAETPSLQDRVSVRLCLSKSLDTTATEGCSESELALFWLGVQLALQKLSSKELAKELAAPTQFGRPNWEEEFAKCAEEARAKVNAQNDDDPMEVSIFACGNKMLVASLESACDNLTDDTTEFKLFAEEF